MVDEPADLETLLALHLVPGIGRIRFEKLENVFGSARAALNAPLSRLRQVPGIGETYAEAIVAARGGDAAKREIDLAHENGIEIITYNDPNYPATLKKSSDPPLVLYVKGNLLPEDALCVAMVGSRHCTYYGQVAAEHIAGGLAREGLTVVSGMARGIDSAAHRGALAMPQGRTIAVMGSGLLNIYPPENKPLFDEIIERGAAIGEFKLRDEPLRGHFPRRNRIIAWMSLGTIVVEADERSGALITAKFAADEGREVFAVPGRIDTPQSRGPHKLIRDGAKLIQCAADVFDEFQSIMEPMRELIEAQKSGTPAEPPPLFEAEPAEKTDESNVKSAAKSKSKKAKSGAKSQKISDLADSQPSALSPFDPLERKILDAFEGPEPAHIDAIIQKCGDEAGAVAGALTVLEIRRYVERLPGNYYVKRRKI